MSFLNEKSNLNHITCTAAATFGTASSWHFIRSDFVNHLHLGWGRLAAETAINLKKSSIEQVSVPVKVTVRDCESYYSLFCLIHLYKPTMITWGRMFNHWYWLAVAFAPNWCASTPVV